MGASVTAPVPRTASLSVQGPLWRARCYLSRGEPPSPAWVVIWRTPVMLGPAFWYFSSKAQAWAARRKLEHDHRPRKGGDLLEGVKT